LSQPLLEGHASVDQTILFDRRNGARAWQRSGVNAGANTSIWCWTCSAFKIRPFCQRRRGRRKIGFDRQRCKELTWMLPFERIPAGNPQAHMVDQYLEFANTWAYPAIRSNGAWTEADIRCKGLPPQFVVLNIGATKPANRWTTEGFSALARDIRTRYGLPCVLTGGREDAPMARAIHAAAGGSVCNLVGKLLCRN
jgi:ADP-heptose:LPS heptosyltransferase